MESFKYISVGPRDALWGLTVTTAGTQSVQPGASYPPEGHNKRYAFDPTRGRVLDEYQLLYIVEGTGILNTEHSGEQKIKAGDMFLIFPGEWHSYSPDPSSGWKEYWIGFRGNNIDNRVEAGFFNVATPLYTIGYNSEAASLFQSAITTAREQKSDFQLLLAGIVNHLLGLMVMISKNRSISKGGEVAAMVDNARAYMLEHLEEKIEMPSLAALLNVSYTTFRRTFKDYTGLAPGQYLINLRIHRAKELLRGTELPVGEIAWRLQFEDPDYFSTRFRLLTGLTPTAFRRG